MGTLDGKVALVTGAGRGIGAAIARKLADSGAKVVVSELDPDPAAETVAAITARGGKAVTLVGDVAAADFGERAVSAALEAFGDLDIIVNNAGYIWNSAIQNMSDAQWYAMIDVHATAPFRILRAAQPHFRAAAKREEEGGTPKYRKVVNISSVSGLYGAATQFAYSAAKASLIGVTRTLAKEWGRFRVNVNCVAFGYIDTRLTQRLRGPAGHDRCQGTATQGRPRRPHDRRADADHPARPRRHGGGGRGRGLSLLHPGIELCERAGARLRRRRRAALISHAARRPAP